ERFLLILSWKDACILKNNINQKISVNNSQQWLALDIEANFPILDKELSAYFFPQAMNLEYFNAISFDKGCYYGQEMIAKIHFKNLNRRVLCHLTTIGIVNCKIGT
ncbi:MAG: tRNA-modifying protein YgfZ, partial [Buchnera aphidicola]|nr:tRNA-modifying protein YgfZ [Buchnera aphidicola]MDE5285918.1 tRNA-modifying protein YgfZ [Buchnera aphidicola]